MTRFRALVLAGLLALPAAASAQEEALPPGQSGRQLPYSRFAVTPFVGVRVPFTTGNEFVFFADETVSGTVIKQERGGALAAGLEAEYRVSGPWSLVGTVSYSPSGTDNIRIRTEGGEETLLERDGPEMIFARAGVSYRIADPRPDARRFRPAGFLVAAPALVRSDPSFGDAANHWALNLGFQATTPLGGSDRFAFQIALDDYFTFWDTDALGASEEIAFSGYFQEPVRIDYNYSSTNILMLRLGGSIRL